MKKLIIVGIIVVFVIIVFTVYFIYLQSVDTKYAIEYSRRMGSYDVSQVDTFLYDDTAITYKDETKTYKELRYNIITAFNEKKFSMANDSSYGSGNKRFVNGVQKVGIQSYLNFNGKSVEVYIEMQLEKTGLNSFKVKSLSSNDEFFGYLFFGITE
ncbi:UNVERIFIED_CONTAM: hypothetical protein Cloal_1095 [Acetivibrio alkalicellulosi]